MDVAELVMMRRVGDPQLAPDAARAAFTLRRTDLGGNRGVTDVYTLALDEGAPKPRKMARASAPRWSPDGRRLYCLAPGSGRKALWCIGPDGTPRQASHLPLDINSFRIAPGGRHVLLSVDVFTDCEGEVLARTRERLDARAADKASGRLHERLFVRHWDTWSDGRRSQLFLAAIGGDGRLGARARWLTRGIDGDVPSKPFGSDAEYGFSPDGKSVYFNARIAGATESWSTNFDIFSVPADGSGAPRNLTAANEARDAFPLASPDGRTLYYLAMQTPGYESDRFAIMALDLATGKRREVAPGWDRSAGPLQLSADGRELYTAASERGNHPLFSVNVSSGEVTAVTGAGKVGGFSVAGSRVLVAHEDFRHPADLHVRDRCGGDFRRVSALNARRLRQVAFGDYEWFDFAGWNGERVEGYVMRPVDYRPGRKYPVAFLVHGGPQGAWSNEFNYRWNPEVFAGAGFAVVAINFHGSTGYGQAFTDAIARHWGDRPLEDLQKGWAGALERFAFLDAERACALGASYGGYMVYWMAGVWNAPWKCFVDHDGVFDTRMLYYATEEQWFPEHDNGGTQYDKPAEYEKFNPLNHVKDWRVPMLVIHGGRDHRIPLSQGIGAFTALQRRGIPSELLTFPDENHWVSKPRNSLQWYRSVIGWLERWTK